MTGFETKSGAPLYCEFGVRCPRHAVYLAWWRPFDGGPVSITKVCGVHMAAILRKGTKR